MNNKIALNDFADVRETFTTREGLVKKKPKFQCIIDDRYIARVHKVSEDKSAEPIDFFVTTDISLSDFGNNESIKSIYYKLEFQPHDSVNIYEFLPTGEKVQVGKITHTKGTSASKSGEIGISGKAGIDVSYASLNVAGGGKIAKSSKEELVIENSYPSEFYTVTAGKAASSVFWTWTKIPGTQGAVAQHTVNVYFDPNELNNQSLDGIKILPSIVITYTHQGKEKKAFLNKNDDGQEIQPREVIFYPDKP